MSITVSHGTQSATLWLSAYYTDYNYLTLEDYVSMPLPLLTDTKKPNSLGDSSFVSPGQPGAAIKFH